MIIWDWLNEEERESVMNWMTTSKSWVLWKQQDSWSTTNQNENTVEGKLKSLLEERGWSLTDKEGRLRRGRRIVERRTRELTEPQKVNMGGKHRTEDWTGGSVRHKNWWYSGQVKLTQSRVGMEFWISDWTTPKQEDEESCRATWMW